MRIPYISILAAGAIALGGCAYGGLGVGLGYGDPYYGYGGHGYGPYGGYGAYPGYYGGFGSFGYPSYGWYDSYYYPGTGYYVYDTYRQPHVMTSTQRAYWSSRSPTLRTSSVRTTDRPNWSGFDRRSTNATNRELVRQQRQTIREEHRSRYNGGY